LSLHLGKTETILFGSKQKLRPITSLNISCNGTNINPTGSVKYLGVTIDQFFVFSYMAESVLKKAKARLKCVYRKKDFLKFQSRKQLVTALVQCHFDYACSVWYNGMTQNLKNRLQITQNQLIIFICNLDSRVHIGPEHFIKLNWLSAE